MKIKKILIFIWNKIFNIKNSTLNLLLLIRDIIYKNLLMMPEIKSIDETLDEIINNKTSVCRYGDGEFKLILHNNITFQKANPSLAKRLKEILLSQEEKLLICLPDVFKDLSIYAEEPKSYWKLHVAKYRLKWNKMMKKEKIYYNSFISRFYYPFKDKNKCKDWLIKLRLIWKDRDVVLIEGKKSRLGVGNNLFDNVNSLERILVPEENAYFHYSDILDEAKKIDKSRLILIAAGPTATVLAYDLFHAGYQAIDIGHVDIEYEWFLRQVKNKVKVENKYVCEAGAGVDIGDVILDDKYLQEIKKIIE